MTVSEKPSRYHTTREAKLCPVSLLTLLCIQLLPKTYSTSAGNIRITRRLREMFAQRSMIYKIRLSRPDYRISEVNNSSSYVRIREFFRFKRFQQLIILYDSQVARNCAVCGQRLPRCERAS